MQVARTMLAVLLVILAAASCTSETKPGPHDTSEAMLGPYDGDAEIRADLITLDPPLARPGDLVAVFFPDERMRGVHYVLESRRNDTWNLEYHLGSDWQGTKPPTSHRVEPTGTTLAFPDIGFQGPGPDVVSIPADIEPGEYRVCTGNSGTNICARLTVVS